MIDQVSQNRRRALVLLVAFGGAAFVVVAVVLLLVGLGPLALVVALVVGVAAAVAAQRASDGAVAKLSGATPADPVVHARLHNLVDGLCVASGLTKPAVLVIDDDARNALAAGSSPDRACVAVTTGLLDALDRVELEGVLAHELSRIKGGATVPGTIAVTTVGLVLRPFPGPLASVRERFLAPDAATLADGAAVEMTRYPPGLASALEVLQGGTTAPRLTSPAIDHLWLVSGDDLEVRIDTLRER